MVFITERFFEVAIESWPEWDLNPHIYIYIYICLHKALIKTDLRLLNCETASIYFKGICF